MVFSKKKVYLFQKSQISQIWLQNSQSSNPGSNHSTTLPIFSSLKTNNSKKNFHFEVPIFLPCLHSTEIFKFLLNSSPSDFSSLGIQVAHFEKHCSTGNSSGPTALPFLSSFLVCSLLLLY